MADTLYWVDANGTEHLFNTNFFKILNGMNGRFMPPIEFVEDESPFQSGSILRNVKVKPRDMDIPILIEATSEIELRQLVRSCLRMFNPLRADGKWRVIAPDGSRRELSCRYRTGLEGQESRDVKGMHWQKLILVFRAFDPYWYDAATIVQTFKINESPGLFFPLLPLRLSSSTVFANITVDNQGDVETWPEWIITGPGENIVLKNMSTDESMNLGVTLDAGESITIDTSPINKTVTKSDGANLFYTLSDNSSLWALQEGQNSIQIEMANATSDSNIQLTYKNRYWGP